MLKVFTESPDSFDQGEPLEVTAAKSAASRSDVGMVLPSSPRNPSFSTGPLQREAEAQTNEQSVEGSSNNTRLTPQINCEEVANKVYHLMQGNLILERERAAKLGG